MERKNICLILLLLFLTSCKLTEKSVTGQWSSGNDTLFVKQDNTFLLADRKDYYVKKDSVEVLDTSFVYSSGKWTVSKRTLFLVFNEDKKNVFGNCGQLWNWTRFFSKYKLIRPRHCYEPFNEFVTFIKIRK